MFSLTVQYSICPSFLSTQSARSHVWARYAQNHSSHWIFHPHCVTGLGFQSSSTWWYFTPAASRLGSYEKKLRPIPNCQELTNKQQQDNTEGSFLSGRNPFYPVPVGQLSPRAVQLGLSQQVWSRGKKLVRSTGVHTGTLTVVLKTFQGKKTAFNFSFTVSLMVVFIWKVLTPHIQNTRTKHFPYLYEYTENLASWWKRL